MKLKMIAYISLIVLSGNCFNNSNGAFNNPPFIKDIYAIPSAVITGETAVITAITFDLENDELNYMWSVTGGTLASVDKNPVTWTAPDQPGTCSITCSVNDGKSEIQESLFIPVLDTGSVLPPPVFLNAEKMGTNSITVTWTENKSHYLAGYNVYRSDYVNNEYRKINTSPVSGDHTTYHDNDLGKGYYNYKVTTLNKKGEEGEKSESTNTLIIVEIINDGYGEYISIPAGPFVYQFNATDTLPGYYISMYEISNEEFNKFIVDGGYSDSQYWTMGGFGEYGAVPLYWNSRDYRGGGIEGNENYPVTGISWYEAQAYCTWLSEKTSHLYRLPSEKEWEKSARGIDGRIFPWGTSILDFTKANYNNNLGRIREISSYPESLSPYGIYNMSGNVWEWCSDNWEVSDNYRIRRGGGWYSNSSHLLTYYRSYYQPYLRTIDEGFRALREYDSKHEDF